MGANLNVFVDYLGQVAPRVAGGAGRAAAMCLVAAAATALNVAGVRQGARTTDVFAVAKLLPLVLLVVLGLPRITSEVLATQVVAQPDWTQAVLLLVFAYGGFEAALIPAGEMKDPRRDTAFALLAALGVIASVYMLVQLAVVGVVPHVAAAKAPVAAAFAVLLGAWGVTLASAAAMVSTFGWTVGAVLASPRILYSMAGRGELPALLARVHARFRTPDAAIYAFSAAGLAFGLSGGFAANATLSAIVRLVTYTMVCGSLLVFRRRPALEGPGFALPAGPAVAAVALLFCAWLLSTRTFTQAWILLAIMAVGWALGRLGHTNRSLSARA
jgi:amino acid transporter